MAKVLEEGADLSGYVELRCSADGALYGSRMLEVKREKDGEQIKLALEVADHPPKPPQEEENSKFGHYADWYKEFTRKEDRVLPKEALKSAKACAEHDSTKYLVFSERSQSMRMGFRKFGWYQRVFLEEDGSIVSSMSDTKCSQRNMAYMNMYTMYVEPEVVYEDVKHASSKEKIWYLNEEEAVYALFFIRCESFKIYKSEWETWVKTWSIVVDDIVELVINIY